MILALAEAAGSIRNVVGESNMNQTLVFYDNHAEEFVKETQKVDFSTIQDRFMNLLSEHAAILDFGCGSGRDSKVFLQHGHLVDAIDGSQEMCKIAEAYIGQPVQHMMFQELKEQDHYDGIWACSSILHLPKDELADVLRKMADALKPDGYIYTSFKYGDFEGVRNGRHFTDLTEEGFLELIQEIPELQVVEFFITGDVREGRGDERWLNVLGRKNN